MTSGPSNGGIDRAAFLARVSAALGRRTAISPSPPPAVDEAIARVTGAAEELVTTFAARAVETGMVVHRVRAAQVCDTACGLLGKLGAKRVVAANIPALAGIAAAVRAAGLMIVPWPTESGLEPLYETDAGITDVQAAIAETGTLVCWSGLNRGRGLSLVPPVHIALVRRTDIVPDLIDYLARHQQHGPGDLPSSIAFITGPSKTADIEGVLITGVHGPREVHILVVEDA